MLERNVTGKQVKLIRQSRGITQEQLAARLNVQGVDIDQTMISKIEEQIRGVSDYEIKALAVALDVNIEDLFKGSV